MTATSLITLDDVQPDLRVGIDHARGTDLTAVALVDTKTRRVVSVRLIKPHAQTMTTAENTLANLDRANRLRWRARILEARAAEVERDHHDPARAARIRVRAERHHGRANDLITHGEAAA